MLFLSSDKSLNKIWKTFRRKGEGRGGGGVISEHSYTVIVCTNQQHKLKIQ